MGSGLGEKAKTFIHSIDSLDADRPKDVPVGKRSSIDDVLTYTTPKMMLHTAVVQTKGWTCPPGRAWIVTAAQVANNNRKAIATLSLNFIAAWKDSCVMADSTAARDVNRYSDALERVTRPVIVAPQQTINITDQAWQAGDTNTFTIWYYEVEV